MQSRTNHANTTVGNAKISPDKRYRSEDNVADNIFDDSKDAPNEQITTKPPKAMKENDNATFNNEMGGSEVHNDDRLELDDTALTHIVGNDPITTPKSIVKETTLMSAVPDENIQTTRGSSELTTSIKSVENTVKYES